MPRNRRRRNPTGNVATNPEGLGVGALAEGDLQHGERPIVESVAEAPQGQPQPEPQPQGGNPAGGLDLFAPTSRPAQPIQDGLPSGPGGTDPVLAQDPDEHLRALYRAFPHDDIRRLLEHREF